MSLFYVDQISNNMKISNSEKVEKLSILLGRICLLECCKIAICCCVDDNGYESDDSIYDNPKKVIRIFNEEKGNGFESKLKQWFLAFRFIQILLGHPV